MGVLEKAAGFVGGSAASIFSLDTAHRAGNAYCLFGMDKEYEQLYFDKYIKYEPVGPGYLMLSVGEVTSNSVLIPPAEFHETLFFKEWAAPQGSVDNVIAILEKSQTSIGAFVVFRHEREGFADDNARRLLRLLTPHLRRAALIGKMIDLKAMQAATFADVLDGLIAGIFLIDAAGRIAHANAAGRDILAAAEILRSVAGRLVARAPQVNKALHDAFRAAARGDATIGVRGVALPLIARNGERYIAHLLPLTSGKRRRTGMAAAATAALFVRKAAMEAPSLPEAIAKAYTLTPTELRVLLALVGAGSGPDAAEALGLAPSTVKTHLGHLFQKTGAKHQTDLVKLVAGFSSPLIG
jgi:DNA-binding CsgD family transcriptional regulator